MRRLGGSVVLAVVLLAGCGGKGSSKTAPTTVPTPNATVTTVVAASPSTTTPSFSGSKNSKYCNLARQFSQTLTPNPSTDAKSLFQQFDSLSSEYLAVVPSEIKADAQSVIDVVRQLETKLKAVNYDYTKLNATDLAAVQDPKFTGALSRIDAYDTQVCGLTTPTT